MPPSVRRELVQRFVELARIRSVSGATVEPLRGISVARWAADARYLQLIEQYSGSLMRLALLLTGDRHDAEDAVQDTLIAVAQAWPRVRLETAHAYLRRALTRRVLDGQRRRREFPAESLPERSVPDLGLLRLEEDRAFVERVRNLPERQRAVIVLRYYADLPDAEIARALRCSVATVRSQAHRALEKLRATQPEPTEESTR